MNPIASLLLLPLLDLPVSTDQKEFIFPISSSRTPDPEVFGEVSDYDLVDPRDYDIDERSSSKNFTEGRYANVADFDAETYEEKFRPVPVQQSVWLVNFINKIFTVAGNVTNVKDRFSSDAKDSSSGLLISLANHLASRPSLIKFRPKNEQSLQEIDFEEKTGAHNHSSIDFELFMGDFPGNMAFLSKGRQ